MTAPLTVYQQSATVIHSFIHHESSLKTLILTAPTSNKSLCTKLTVQTLKYRAILLYILQYVNNKAKKHQQLPELQKIADAKQDDKYSLSMCGALLLLYDTLLGAQQLPTFKQSSKTFTDTNNVQHTIKHKNDRYGFIHGTRFITTHLTALRNTLQYVLQQSGVPDAEQLLPAQLRGSLMSRKYQRYVRINTLIADKASIKHNLAELGYSCVEAIDAHTSGKQYCYDPYIANLLQFPANDNYIVQSGLVKSNHLIIQDKSSCFPCLALNPVPGCTMIDCCAAPGNKSSLCAALMNNTGTVHAIERDGKRCRLMQQRMQDFRATAVQTHCRSFLDIEPSHTQFSTAQYILLDPSCSGSGTPNVDKLLGDDYDRLVQVHDSRVVTLNGDAADSERVRLLHDEQVQLLKHAMMFPRVERISYSTCSVYELENECVIHDVLASAHQHGFKLAHALPKWHRRGLHQSTIYPNRQYDWHKRVVRVDNNEDHTGGFFVAVFARTLKRTEPTNNAEPVSKKMKR